MEPKLREYIENLFLNAPHSRQAYELKEEIICNTIERYHDLLNEGKSQNDAFNLAIEGIGDINELITALKAEPVAEEYESDFELFHKIKDRATFFKSLAAALYFVSIFPLILLDNIYIFNYSVHLSGAITFWIISIATGFLIYGCKTKFFPAIKDYTARSKIKTNTIMVIISIELYISCLTPFFILREIIGGLSFIFVAIVLGAATGILIYANKNKTPLPIDANFEARYAEWSKQKKQTSALYKALVAILWVTISIIFIIITFTVGIYDPINFIISCSIFLLAIALQNLMKAIFEYVGVSK
jgi:hypothetical protein